MTPELERRLAELPTEPGVYLMRGEDGVCFYVGKATNLRSRVRSYFQGRDDRPFVRLLDDLLADVDVIVTRNAKEALLLENTLIKSYRPRFNVELRDDKNYLALRIDAKERWPRVETVRRIRNDGADYFGPFDSAQAVRRTLQLLNRYFHLRTCNDSTFRQRSRPCLQYQMGRCPAPCVLSVDRDAYMDDVRQAALFLSGRSKPLLDELRAKMEAAAEQLEFERAAQLRDQIQSIERSLRGQRTVQTKAVDQDVIGLARNEQGASLVVLCFRGGRLSDLSRHTLPASPFPDEALIEEFLSRYYLTSPRTPPAEICVPVELREAEALTELLSSEAGHRAEIVFPRRGARRDLLDLAERNARAHRERVVEEKERRDDELLAVQRRLRLPNRPTRIECYDISNFQGDPIVAGRSVLIDGQPSRADYRRYKIRTTATQDDFQSMFEVFERRARRAHKGDEPLPDLLLVDGGPGQLARASEALAELGIHDAPLAAIAKARPQGVSADGSAIRTSERIYLPGQKNPIVLRPGRPETRLLTYARDEAHRTAIRYHRKRRRTDFTDGALDAIPGVGPARTKALLRALGSVRKISRASKEELMKVDGISAGLAQRIREAFAEDESADGDLIAPPTVEGTDDASD